MEMRSTSSIFIILHYSFYIITHMDAIMEDCATLSLSNDFSFSACFKGRSCHHFSLLLSVFISIRKNQRCAMFMFCQNFYAAIGHRGRRGNTFNGVTRLTRLKNELVCSLASPTAAGGWQVSGCWWEGEKNKGYV